MARRRKPTVPPPGPKKRDRAAEYARRNAQARSYGFRSYWEQRQHGEWASLLRYIEPGDYVQLYRHLSPENYERNARGEWVEIVKVVHPDNPPGGRQRRERMFTLRNISDAQLARLIQLELARGADMTLIPSLDQQRLLSNGTDKPTTSRRGTRTK